MTGEGRPGGPKRTQEGAEWEMFTDWMKNFFKAREAAAGKTLSDEFTIDELVKRAPNPSTARPFLEKHMRQCVIDGLVTDEGNGVYRLTDDTGSLVFGPDIQI